VPLRDRRRRDAPRAAVAQLKLGKKTTALYEEAKAPQRQLDREADGPPPVRPSDVEIDQARALPACCSNSTARA
jgi:hypothetical protein